jgi:hypothetical protein
MVTIKAITNIKYDLGSLELKQKYKHLKNMGKKSRRPTWTSRA